MTALGSGAMFDAIAPRYDLLNRLMSLGADQRWRRRAVAALEPGPGRVMLDLATGTADLAIACARAGARVVGLDPSPGMLALGRAKAAAAGLAERVALVVGDAQDLAFPDASFDAAGIAFGIRNVPDRGRALAEMARVVRRGGRVVVLELAEPRSPLARFHVHTVVPWLGARLSGAPAYKYLQESIARFPPADEFAATVAAAGLTVEQVRPMMLGAVTLFVARRP